MRAEEFAVWMEERGLQKKTIQNRISNCRNVEKYDPELDAHYAF